MLVTGMVQELFTAVLPMVPFVILVSLRVATVFVSLPAPFSSGAPAQVRVALSLFVALTLATPLYAEAPRLPLTALALGRAAFGEVLVGAVIGLTVRVTLVAADAAGNVAGLTMGQGFASSVDPTFGETSLPLGRTLGSAAVLLFFLLRGPHTVILALAGTLRTCPVGGSLAALSFEGAIHVGSDLMAQGLRIASPVVGTMFLVQLGMGLIARSAQRVQIFTLTFAITSAVGTVVLLAAAPSVLAALAESIQRIPSALRTVLGGA